MTLLPPPLPPVRRAFYCYAVIDVLAPDDADPVFVGLSRKQCREYIDEHPLVAGNLRIRRGRTTLYQS